MVPEAKLLDLSTRLHTPEFRELLLLLVGWRPDDELNQAAVDEAIDGYSKGGQTAILGIERDNSLVGIIGLEFNTPNTAVIHHIVVHPQWRRLGIGHAMIEAARQNFRLKELVAETDKDAVDFYRRCGFAVQSLGEKYPGTERFRCVLKSE